MKKENKKQEDSLAEEKKKNKILQGEKDQIDDAYRELESKHTQLDRDFKKEVETRKDWESEIEKLKNNLEDLMSKKVK